MKKNVKLAKALTAGTVLVGALSWNWVLKDLFNDDFIPEHCIRNAIETKFPEVKGHVKTVHDHNGVDRAIFIDHDAHDVKVGVAEGVEGYDEEYDEEYDEDIATLVVSQNGARFLLEFNWKAPGGEEIISDPNAFATIIAKDVLASIDKCTVEFRQAFAPHSA